MYSRTLSFALAALAAVTLAGCRPALPVPARSDSFSARVPFDTLVAGRRLYVARCGSCHTLYLPQKYDSAAWRGHVESMQRESGATPAENRLIIQYLQAYGRK